MPKPRGIGLVFSLILLIGIGACGEEPAPQAHVEPAHVENARPEADLATIQLTAEAEGRLGIETAAITTQSLGATRTIPGEIIVPQGRAMVISAPFAGIALQPAGRGMKTEGASVGQGEAVLQLQPLPGDGEALRLRADAGFAEQHWQAALERAEEARAQFAAGQLGEPALDAAEAELAIAQTGRDASRALWSSLEGNGQSVAGPMAIAMAAPRAGVLQNIYVTPGQAVSPGQPMFNVVNQNVLWVKVPVYAGELRTVNRQQSAEIRPLGQWDATNGMEARPLAGPLTGDINAASVDLFYEFDNSEHLFHPSERVSVALPIHTQSEALVVPLAAIWRDIHGGEWVYQNIAPQTYARRRISITRTAGDFAVLSSGPPAGTMVATVGIAELAGTEFEVPH